MRAKLLLWVLVPCLAAALLAPLAISNAGSLGDDTPALEMAGSIGGAASAVAIDGTVAYVGEASGFSILRIHPAARFQLLARLALPERVRDIQVVAGRAYLAVGRSGLYIVDVRQPEQPSILGRLDGLGNTANVSIVGTFAYVGAPDTGLSIIDISTPDAPRPVGHYIVTLSGLLYPRMLQVEGEIAYLATSLRGNTGGVHIVDVSDPESPALLASVGSDDAGDAITSVSVEGAQLLVGGRDGVEIFDVTQPANPQLLGTYPGAGNGGVYAYGDRAYVNGSTGALHVLDISVASAPELLGSYEMPNSNWSMAVDGTTAYVANDSYGLQVLDIGDPAQIARLPSGYTLGEMWRVMVEGSMAYVAAGPSGMQVLDVTDAGLPQPFARSATSRVVTAVRLAGERAYLAEYDRFMDSNGTGEIQILDMRQPLAPITLGTYPLLAPVYDIAITNSRMYLAGYDGFEIVDISNPGQPAPLGSQKVDDTGMAFHATRVQVENNLAYLATSRGLLIVDVGNPAQPAIRGQEGQMEMTGLHVVGSRAYTVGKATGFRVVDIGDPARPRAISISKALAFPYAVYAKGDLAYVADADANDGRIHVFDVGDPSNPTLVARSTAQPFGIDLLVTDQQVIVVSATRGLHLFNPAQHSSVHPTPGPPYIRYLSPILRTTP